MLLRKIIISHILLLMINMEAFSQIDRTVGKYSYPIFVIAEGVQHGGTAFFYRHNDTTYLVSNYHAIKGMSPMHNRLNFRSDVLYLKYKLKSSLEEKMVSFDIRRKNNRQNRNILHVRRH